MVIMKTQDWRCLDIGSTATAAPHLEKKKNDCGKKIMGRVGGNGRAKVKRGKEGLVP